MPDLFHTRAAKADDVPHMARIADKTLFPGEMLADMSAPALSGQSPDLWHVVLQGDTLVGFAFAQPEAMTDRTWNLRAIATAPNLHGQGGGTVLLSAIETALAGTARLLLIDTTQTEDQARARRFYAARGYIHVATIPGFFGDGEDKVSFVKTLRT